MDEGKVQEMLSMKPSGAFRNQLEAFLGRLRLEEIPHTVTWGPKAVDVYLITIQLPGRKKMSLELSQDGRLMREVFRTDSGLIPGIKTIQDVYDYLFGVD